MITVIYGKERVHFSEGGAASGASLQDESSASSISINFSTTTITEFKHTLLSWWQNEHKQSSNTTVQLSSVEEIKLILNGKILSNADQLLMDLFPASNDGTPKKALKITMVANPLTQEAIQQLQSEKQKQEELASKLKRRKLAASKAKSSLEGRRRQPITYGFHRITTLANLPNEEKAKAILEQLANDPGVIAVMNKYKFTVNELTELYPEGQVGVSDVCVMGLNENHGQKILLRLRTDDLKGFRKLLSIKKVLYHELAHNIYSEHDNNFYILMRQIEKDANELSWEKSRGFSLLSARERESYIRPEKHFDEEEEEEQEQTVFTLGGSDSANVSNPTIPARRVAGEAAILRFHQFQKQKEEQKYNQYVKNTSSSSSTSNQNSDEFISEKSNVDGKEHFQRHSDSEGTEGTDSGSEKEQGSSEKKDGSTLIPMEVEDVTVSVVDYIAPNSQPIHNEPDQLSEMVVIENPSEATLTPSDSGPSTIEIAKKEIDEPKDVVVEETKRIERLERKKEEINKMFEDSVVMILADETLISTVEKILSIKDIVFRIIDEKILNQDRFKQLIDTIQLFVTILQNIQNHPGEEKYKRIKKTNKIFLRTIDGMEESLGILYQSGFEEETSSSSTSELIYKKKDTGLLYLVKSLLESILRILKEE